jgi:hypothetical protein
MQPPSPKKSRPSLRGSGDGRPGSGLGVSCSSGQGAESMYRKSRRHRTSHPQASRSAQRFLDPNMLLWEPKGKPIVWNGRRIGIKPPRLADGDRSKAGDVADERHPRARNDPAPWIEPIAGNNLRAFPFDDLRALDDLRGTSAIVCAARRACANSENADPDSDKRRHRAPGAESDPVDAESRSRAISSETDAVSRREIATNQEYRAGIRFNSIGYRSRVQSCRKEAHRFPRAVRDLAKARPSLVHRPTA